MSTAPVSSTAAQAAMRRSDDQGIAATTANYVVHARQIGSKDHRVDDYRPYVPPKEISPAQEVLASAGAAASLTHDRRTGPDQELAPEARDRSAVQPTKAARLSTASSRAAFLAGRDRGSGLAGESQDVSGAARSREQAAPEEHLEDDPNARVAATSAVTGRGVRIETPPSTGPEAYHDRIQAKSAATVSHSTARDGGEPTVNGAEETLDGARIHGIAVAKSRRDMYTAHPPVGIEVDEKKKEATRQAAVVSMAQQMYATMPRAEELAAAEVSSVYSDGPVPRAAASAGQPQEKPSDQTRQAVYLHTVAERRVAERLAKLDEQRAAEQQGVVTSRDATTSPRPRSSASSSRVRRWSSSEGDAESVVRRRAQRKPFQPRPVEEEKEEEAEPMDPTLMAAAKRNTNSIMKDVDQRIYYYSGKPSQAKIEEWEKRAREHKRASGAGPTTSFSAAREDGAPEPGDPEELARRRLKPTLNGIDDRVNERRGKVLAKQLDAEHEKRFLQQQKRRDAETAKMERQVENRAKKEEKARNKPSKEEKALDKSRKKAAKEAQKAEKKEAKKSKKRDVNGDQHGTSQDEATESTTAGGAGGAGAAGESRQQEVNGTERESKPPQKDAAQEDNAPPTPRDSRGTAMTEDAGVEPSQPATQEPSTKRTSRFGNREATKSSSQEKTSSEPVKQEDKAGSSGAAAAGSSTATDGPTATGPVPGALPADETATAEDPRSRRAEREEPRYSRAGPSESSGPPASSTEQTGAQDGEQDLGYAIRQWSTSPVGRRGKKGKESRTSKTTTTTTKKERRFLSTFFSRSRNGPGRQGSFDSEPRTARIATEHDSELIETEAGTSDQPASAQAQTTSKFKEELHSI